jgi:uncharacterized protein YjiS (DUF1127 family)
MSYRTARLGQRSPRSVIRHTARRISMLLLFIQTIRALRKYQRGVAELSQLSDRELSDIGLNRSDIPRGWSALFPKERKR